MIMQKAQGALYRGVFFIYNGGNGNDSSCIEGSGNCCYTRIQDCRVYKGFSAEGAGVCMFDFSRCTDFSGIIGGNISSGYGSISVIFANQTHKNNTAFYGHTNVSILTD